MADDEREEDVAVEEEEEEDWSEPIPVDDMPAGNTTTFVGGFSPVTTVTAALANIRDKDDQVIVLPGKYETDVSLDSTTNDGLRFLGDANSQPGDIVFTGLLDVAYSVPAAAQNDEPAADEDEDGPKKPAEPPRPLTIRGMTFLAGAVFSELTQGAVDNCVFGHMYVEADGESVPRTVRCHGLSTVAFNGCRAYGSERSAVYCFPHARNTFVGCSFIGAEKPPPPPPVEKRKRRPVAPPPPPPPSVPATCECEVGVQCDDATAKFTDCIVNRFNIGMYCSAACKGAVIEQCSVSEIATVGILLGDECNATVRKATVKLCGRECIVVGAGAHPTLRENVLVGDVRLKRGAVASGASDNILGLNGNIIDEGGRFTVKGFTSVAKDPSLVKPKKVVDEDEE